MSKEARKVLGLSEGDEGVHVYVPAEKNSAAHLKKQSGDINDVRNLAGSAIGEGGSHGAPASKRNVGGTAGGSVGGNAHAEGHPHNVDRKNLGKVQRAALENHERRENGGEDTSKGVGRGSK